MAINNPQKGFTLVELSIVLVIIGLIISSVLVGQELIRSAELRSTINQYESFNAAIATFRGRYDGIPGDVDGATDFGFTGDGDGDNLLIGTGTAGHAANENVFFWNHLGSTGAALIPGSYDGTSVTNTAGQINDSTPQAKSGENWGVFEASNVNYFIIGAADTATTNSQTTVAPFNSLDAFGIDSKIDDGRPMRGIVQARGAHINNADTNPTYDSASDAAACTGGSAGSVDATATYNTAFTELDCTLRLRFQL